MTPQELKSSILQLAVQGRLVEQRPEEGTAEELYRQIQEEKQCLIKEGKIKKEKPLPKIAEDELPFDVPESWKWVRMGSIGSWSAGATPSRTKPEYYGGNIPWLKTGDLNDGYIESVPESITQFALDNTSVRLNPSGSVLMAMYGATIGKLGILSIPATTNQACCACIVCRPMYNKYLFYYLMARRTRFIKMGEGGAQPNISKEKIISSLLPLPPLSEQKRIVAKIEELLPYIDRYEKAWSKLEDFNKRFPNDMQKSVLQMAIQGKLVEQRPEEGTGEELYKQIQAEKQKWVEYGIIKKDQSLPEIDDDNTPFDIPDSWKWVYIGDLFYHNTGKALNSSNKDGLLYTYITTSNVYWNHFELDNLKSMLFTESELDKCTVFKGELLVLEGGEVGRAAIWNYDFPMRIQNHIHRLKNYYPICVKYFYYIFYLYKKSGKINGKGIGIKGLSSKALHSLVVPLPPLAEQNRIVQKLEEILPLCDKLK